MELFRLLGTIAIDKGKAIAGLNEVTDKAKTTSEKMSTGFKTIGEKSIELGKKMAVMSAGAGAAMGGIIKSAANVKAMNSQFAQTFAGVEKEATTAMRNVASESGIMESRLKGVGTSIYAFAKTTGMETPQALGMMERALQVTADSAAYYDRSLEETSESLQSFLKGNFENDAALGLSCTETTRNAAANKLYGKSFMELSESQKQLTLLQMVEDANKLSGAMGQAARESDGWENVTGNLKESIVQLAASIGEVVLPTAVKFIQKATDFVNKFQDMGNGAKIFIVALLGITAAASPVLIVFGHMMKTIGQMIEGYKKLSPVIKAASNDIKAFKSGALASTAATVRDTAAKIVNAVATSKVGTAASSAAKKVIVFANAHKVAMLAALGLAAPIIALVGYMMSTGASADEAAEMITAFSNKIALAITMFANQLPEMIASIMPAITQAVNAIVVAIPALVPVLIQAGIQLFMAFVQSIQQIIEPLVAALPQIVDAVVGALPVLIPALIQAGVTLFMALVKAIPKIIPALVGALPQIVKAIWDGLVTGLQTVWTALKQAALSTWESIKEKAISKWNEIKDKILAPVRTLKSGIDSAIKTIKDYMSFSGLASKVKKTWDDIKSKIISPIKDAKDKVNDILDKIKGFFPLSIGKIFSNLKLPHISVDGGKAPFGIGGKGSLPKFSVNWNAKGAIFDEPTIFATKYGLQGVGEAGKEAVTPIDTLQQYVAAAVASQNGQLIEVLNAILAAIRQMDAGLYQTIEAALDNRKIQWNDRELGRFVKTYA